MNAFGSKDIAESSLDRIYETDSYNLCLVARWDDLLLFATHDLNNRTVVETSVFGELTLGSYAQTYVEEFQKK